LNSQHQYMKINILFVVFFGIRVSLLAQDKNPMPATAPARAIASEQMGNSKSFPEMKMEMLKDGMSH
jgi:hypothetical protein